MAAASPEAFFKTGVDVLADLGYGGLKLAEVCRRLQVTTGSFYHYFTNWSAYTRDLIDYWVAERDQRLRDTINSESDPRARLDVLLRSVPDLSHSAEAAIRVWSALDPGVRAVQIRIDQQRFDAVYQAALEILQHPRQARLFAECVLYMLVGYEQATLPRDETSLIWIIDELLAALDRGGFAAIPDAK